SATTDSFMSSPARNDARQSAEAAKGSVDRSAVHRTAGVPQRSPRLTRRQALGALGAFALPWERLVAQAAGAAIPGAAAAKGVPGTLPPDLVNLHPVMQWMADQRPLHLSFLDPTWRELEAWKNVARPFFRERLRYDPTPLPLRADTLQREERDGFTLETLTISATPAYSIPARVLVPTGRRGRLPAVVAIHDHGGRYV